MRYHVPFAHRQRSFRHPGPIYIGFDEPVSIQKRKPRFNWFGFSGLLLALISPLTLFLAAPLALLFSLLGMRRKPRGLATAGLVLSLMATAVLSAGIFGIAHSRQLAHQQHRARIVQLENREQIAQTMGILKTVQDELRQFRSEHGNQLPGLEDGMMMTVRFDDAWEQPLRYGVTTDGCIVRSSGPDREFDTSDDLTVTLDGKPIVFSLGTTSELE
jgi:hypothetical protein